MSKNTTPRETLICRKNLVERTIIIAGRDKIKNKLIVLLLLFLLVKFSSNVQAFTSCLDNSISQNRQGLSQIYLGGSMNQLSNSGGMVPGAFFGQRIWISEELAIGTEIDKLDRYYLTGFSGTFAFKVEENINIIASSGSYFTEADKEVGFGINPGIEFKLIGESRILAVRGGYRFLNINDEDYSGLEFATFMLFNF